MERKKASDYDQELLDLYDRYCHSSISRREFFDKAAKFAVGGVTVAALVEGLLPNYALANQVDDKDPRIRTEFIDYSSPRGYGKIRGYLTRPAGATGKVGVVGFCYGGGVSNKLAVRLPKLAASVPFYGRQPAAGDVPKIKAPLLLHYAGLDKRINKGWPDYEKALKANNKEYTAHIYPEVNHGFHNDTTARYDEAAAELAWQRTIDFFNEKLA